MLSVLVGILAIFVHSRSDADELLIDSLKEQQNMIDNGSGLIWYLSGASRKPQSWKYFPTFSHIIDAFRQTPFSYSIAYGGEV